MRLLVGFMLLLTLHVNAQKIVRNQTFTSYQLFEELNRFEGEALIFDQCNFTHARRR